MTASSSIISLANRSLLGIGARATIASLSEGSTEANAISILYQSTFEQLARSAPWNCLRQQQTLTLIAAATGTPENPNGTTLPLPPVPWLYQYGLPSTCLDMRYIVPSLPGSSPTGTTPLTTASVTSATWISVDGDIPFVVAYATDTQNNPIQVILTNQTQAQAVFTVNQSNPVIFDSLFEQAIVAALGAYLVPALSLNLQLMNMQIKVAESAITQARVRDGDEGTTVQDHIPDWITSRRSGGYLSQGNYNQYGVWTNMMWPGGF